MTRKTFELFGMHDERGVSPVIGVILMVAITVILAAVIGTFVLGLGENVSTSTPQSQLTLSADSENISIDHKGGDPVPVGETQIEVKDSNGATIATFSPSSSSTQELTVGDTGIIYMNNSTASAPTLHWTGYVMNDSGSNLDTSLTTGTPYTVQIVHTESDQLIMDRTVRP